MRDAFFVGLLASLVVSPNLLVPLNTFDGGISASTATFMLHGQLPYRDFWLLYGPLSGVVVAVATLAAGPSVLLLRLLGLGLVMSHAGFGYLLLRTRAPHVPSALVAVAAVIPTSAIVGLEASAWNLSVTFVLAAIWVQSSRPGHALLAGVLVGLAFLSRLDVGGYGLLAVLFLPGRLRVLLGFTCLAFPFMLAVLATTPLADAYEQLIWYPIVGPRQFRGVAPPDLTGAEVIILGLPLILLPRLAIIVSAIRVLFNRAIASEEGWPVSLIVFAAFCQLQTQGRADVHHFAQASVPALLLIGTWVAEPPRRFGGGRLAAVLGASALSFMVASLSLAKAARPVESSDVGLIEAIQTLKLNTSRDDAVFVGLTANRYTFANPLLAYYLADRRSGVRVPMYNPGITNRDGIQREMVRQLRETNTSLLLLDSEWAELREPTNDSRIPGSTILDSFIAEDYEVACEFDMTLVLRRTDRVAPVVCANDVRAQTNRQLFADGL